MTKKQEKARAAAWLKALRERRVIRYRELDRLVSYPTIEARDKAIEDANKGHVRIEIVIYP